MGALIESGYGSYVGTSNKVKTSFNLTYNGSHIFKKELNSEDNNFVGLGSDSSILSFDNHFFVSGEEINYDYGSGSPIGIATTVISGVSTDKLPSTIYAIKIDNNKIKVASSPENALKFIPKFLEITTLGIGTQHYFISKKQNTKSLITIDNVIQSPVVSTGVTTILLGNINITQNTFPVYNPKLFSSGDIIKINSEIMKVNSIVNNSLQVTRQFLGTEIQNHNSGSLVAKLSGNYNIVDNTLYFRSAPYGNAPQENPLNPYDVDYAGIVTSSSFSGRIFLRTAESDTTKETYTDNYTFDNISNQIIGLTTSYELTVNGQSITNISENNSTILVRSVFQTPKRTGPKPIIGDYYLSEQSGKTKIYFSGEKSENYYDINSSSIPLGGIIVSVGSTSGNGYQPLVSAGGTALVSIAGSIDSIIIGNNGSGYRSGIQTNVFVGVKTENLFDLNVEIIGTASLDNGKISNINITNPGSGYSQTNPPIVIIDSPVGYKNIPLVYSQYSQSGIGTGASVDLEVSLSGKVSSFQIKNNGYGYEVGDILTVEVGGTHGIQTDNSVQFEEFQIYVDETYKDDVSGWTFGELEVLDSFDSYFNGTRKKFFIRKEGLVRSIRAKKGSDIDVEPSLLVFINNILQVPGESYTFTGGSVITFKEAPKGEDPNYPGSGDKSKILFYRGTKDIDVIDKDILETVEEGDIVDINSDLLFLDEDERLVTSIISSDSINTNPYAGPGSSADENLLRPISWCKSKVDKVIDGKQVTKDRIYNEALINPITNIIQSVGIGSTAEIFVENVKSFFDNEKELAPSKIKSTIQIISQNQIKSEIIDNVIYEGDFGFITGITTTTVGVASTAIILSLFIPENSVLNDPEITKPIINTSGISTGSFFVIKNTNIGNGVTSLYNDGAILSIGSTFIDNVYQAYSADFSPDLITQSQIIVNSVIYGSPSIINDDTTILIENGGTLTISDYSPLKVTTLIEDYNGIDSSLSLSQSSYFGEYSWGRITAQKRKNPKEFEFYPTGTIGISTSAVVRRFYPLKYLNYNP